MTQTARLFIDSFDALPERDKHEVLAQLLPRLMDKPCSPWSDDELAGAADLIFRGYDRRDAQG